MYRITAYSIIISSNANKPTKSEDIPIYYQDIGTALGLPVTDLDLNYIVDPRHQMHTEAFPPSSKRRQVLIWGDKGKASGDDEEASDDEEDVPEPMATWAMKIIG